MENPLNCRGYELYGLAILAFIAMLPLLLAVSALLDWIRSRLLKKPRRRWIARAALVANIVAVLCAADAWLIEPHVLTVTRMSDVSPSIAPRTGSLKIIHITDIHFVRHTKFTGRILTTVSAQKPDLILVTGDIHQLGDFDQRQLGEFLSKLCDIAPAYAVTGYDEVEVLQAASGDRLRLVDDTQSAITVRGTRILISGISMYPHEADARDSDGLRLLLAHRPDDVACAGRLNADWAFAGHTHGGQVRLPFWGAVTTASTTGKRFEYGHYKVGETDFFVSRGLGLEPRPAPQVRFLCPPEIMVLTLSRGE